MEKKKLVFMLNSMSKTPYFDSKIDPDELEKIIKSPNTKTRAKVLNDIGRDLGLEQESELFVDNDEKIKGLLNIKEIFKDYNQE
jgi:hypothetical protein